MQDSIKKGEVKSYVRCNGDLYEILNEMGTMGCRCAIEEMEEKQIIEYSKKGLINIFDFINDDHLKAKFKDIETEKDLKKFMKNLEKYLGEKSDKLKDEEEGNNLNMALNVVEDLNKSLQDFKPVNIEYEVYKDIYDILCIDDFDKYLFYLRLKSEENTDIIELFLKEEKLSYDLKTKLKF